MDLLVIKYNGARGLVGTVLSVACSAVAWFILTASITGGLATGVLLAYRYFPIK